jgi:hypothetical protein
MCNGIHVQSEQVKPLLHYPSYIRELLDGEPVPMPDGEKWWDTVKRITVPGRVAEVNKEIYWYFLEVLPPRFLEADFFAFAEGMAPYLVFWADGDRYFSKQLTWKATERFCRSAHLLEDYWAI